MKILQINIRVNKGSVSRITEQIGLKIMEQGWESYVAYGRPSNPSKSHMIPIGTYNGVKLHYFMSNLTGRHGLFSTSATKKLVERIREIKPDIIHLQNIHGYYINYRVLFEYLNSIEIPIVWTLHDCWSFTGHCSHFVSANCDRWKSGCHDCPLKKDYPKSLFFDFSKKDYKLKKKLFAGNRNLHLVPVSHWLEGLVRQSYFKDHDIRVIHNGIDLNVFYPRQHKSTERTKILGVAGVWGKGKGLYDFYALRERLPKDQFDITLIGLSSEQMADIPDGIIGVQRTDSVNQLAEYYSDADIFVNLTYADTFPTVNLEALACGTPVITYRTGGSPETIDKSTGVVIEQGNLDELVQAVNVYRHLIPWKREEQRIACRNRAKDYYERGKCFEEYIDLYKSLTGGGKFLIIGVATSWSKGKGLEDYVSLRNVLGDEYQIALIGVNDKVRESLPDGIIGLSKTDSIEKLAFIYSIANVVTSLSYAESLGMTPIEGMACGTPAIVYDNTAQPELVDEKCGLVVPTGDIKALQNAIEVVRRNGKIYYSEACVARAKRCFDKEERYNDYINLYKELCDQKN